VKENPKEYYELAADEILARTSSESLQFAAPFLNPVEIIENLGVDSGLIFGSTSITPRHQTKQLKLT
jgi:hypothetical protein